MRLPELQAFLDCAERAILSSADAAPEARAASSRIFAALRTKPSPSAPPSPERVPACNLLPAAVAAANTPLALSILALDPLLAWYRRPGTESLGAAFFDGHANSLIVGPEGMEKRADVWAGVSLMAPHLTYPDHHHPPEEVYVVLSDGMWRRGTGRWFRPGLGGIVYNEPHVVHAMKSEAAPLFAAWFLWTGKAKEADWR